MAHPQDFLGRVMRERELPRRMIIRDARNHDM